MLNELEPLTPDEVVVRANQILDAAAKVRASVMEAANVEVSDPQELHGLLVSTRHSTDKLERALMYGLALQQTARSRLAVAKAEVEEAELLGLDSVRKTGEFVSAKEKNLEFVRLSVEQRRALRQAEEVAGQVDAAVEILKLLHRGADSTRRDIEVRLRAVSLTSSLERG